MTEESTNTTKKPSARKASSRKPAARTQPAKAEQPERVEDVRTIVVKKRTFSPDDYVTVRNGFDGKLVYKSSKTGEKYVFSRFGDEHDMEIQELKKARNDSKKFFENNWFLIDDPAVIEYLGVERFYKNALSFEEFDTLFDLDAEAIEKRVSALSKGQQNSLKYRARQLIRDGKIDSIKVINTLERLLETELIEK